MKNASRPMLKRPVIGLGQVKLATAILLVTMTLSANERLQAQGIDRPSLTGESAVGANYASDGDKPYNVLIGPVSLRASAGLTTSFNDNINVAHHGRQADIITTPQTSINGVWQMTALNNLTFGLGIGYQWYAFHPENSSVWISPASNSGTSFNIFVGDFKITLHDNFSFQNDPIAIGQLSGTAQFAQFQNDAGFSVTYDMDDFIFMAGYDHSNQWIFTNAYKYLTYQSNSINGSITYNVSREITTGVEASLSGMTYDQNIMNNSQGVSAGAFFTAQCSEYIALNGHAGWTGANYDQGGLVGDNENLGSFYGSLGINHRINDVLTESLTAGQGILPGIESNYTKRIYANYNLNWKMTEYISTGTSLWWENLADSNSINAQNSNRYGAGVNLGYSVNEHSSVSASYSYVLKDCDQSQFSYYQNQLTLGFNYQF